MDDEKLLQSISDMMDKKLEPVNSRLDKVDCRLDKMENRLDKIESEVSALKSGQLDLRREIKEVDSKVSDTYKLALDTWGTSTENRTWLQKLNNKNKTTPVINLNKKRKS